MKQEERELLLVDLCGRLPYGVKVEIKYTNMTLVEDLFCINQNDNGIFNINPCENDINQGIKITENIKPYLRPMSSMTKEENEMYIKLNLHGTHWGFCNWCNKNMFDYRGLIEKGLALPAPEGMY